ncbi:uncharacterized protein [Littorina saxatilis]|uniref:Uncharacterized protein n=1 Tax=Littorina saxatilis TaxID=31220 RepID=A0AAN9GAD7_9CAEN
MEWERKFYDIVRETECNLTNARRKLQGSTAAKPLNNNSDYLSNLTPSWRNSPSFTTAVSTSYVNNNDHINSIRRQMGWNRSSSPIPQTSMVAGGSFATGYSSETRELLSKVDSQNLMIEKLESLVRTLNQEKDQYRKQIRDLQNEVGAISSRLNESTRVDPHLETQVDLMRYEVRMDMQRLQNMISASKTSSLCADSLERSFKDMQQNVHSEMEEIRRDVNSMTHRVGKLELNVSSNSASHTHRDTRDRLNLKRDALNGSASSLLGHNSGYLGHQPSPVNTGDVLQMRELRSTIAQFHNKLDSLESRLAASRAAPPAPTSLLSSVLRKSALRSYKPTPKLTLEDFLDDDDDDDDDDDVNSDLASLDLSDDTDLESDVTEDLSDDLDNLVRGEKTSTTKFTTGSKSPAKETTFSLPESDLANSDSNVGDLISDVDLDNLDLDSAASDPVDLDSLEDESVDLKLDDL